MNQHVKAICKLIDEAGRRHHRWRVFSDFVEMGALAISNRVDYPQYIEREARYMEIVKAYDAKELDAICKMLAELVMALEAKPGDILGQVFHELELHNKYTGQFFTPYSLCQMMAAMQVEETTDRIIKENGFITVSEPACGSGAMVIAFSDALKQRGHDISACMHVTAVDVDPKCVHMAYLQFSILGIPAIVIHGNTLALEEWAYWGTPHHIIDRWPLRLRDREPTETKYVAPISMQCLPLTSYKPQDQLSLFGDAS